ncbi:MAG TPA: stage II sporulation protein D [Bacillota bacterium]
MGRIFAGTVILVFVAVVALPALVIGRAFGPGLLEPGQPGEIGNGPAIKVRVDPGGKVQSMALEAYVKGVVAAEMPANFEPEALKAQAIVARTLAVKKMRAFGGAGLEGDLGADVSTDPAKGQAWRSTEELKKSWGWLNYPTYWAKISKAVSDTEGLVIVYDGLPIDAQFHSTSAGPTENSEDVWSEKIPYLRSVPCDWDKESPWYTSTAKLTLTEVEAKLPGTGALSVYASTGQRSAIEIVDRTPTGRAKTVRVGGKTMRATDFRLALGLRSSKFTVTVQNGEAVFQVRGYGHGVGLCQFGANGLANLGKKYQEIIQHYYTGVSIEKMSGS